MSILKPGEYEIEKDILPRIDTDKNKYIFEVVSSFCMSEDDDDEEEYATFEDMGLKCVGSTGCSVGLEDDEAIVQNLKPMTIKEFCKFHEETMDMSIDENEDIEIIRAEKCD